MKNRFLSAVGFPIAAALFSPVPAQAQEGVIDNVIGYTLDDAGRVLRFEGLVIDERGTVARLLRKGDPRPSNSSFRIDGHRRIMLPGFFDAHGHVADYGFQALGLDLTDAASLADVQTRLARYAATTPGNRWIRGGGWNEERWKLGRFPTAADVEAAALGRPVLLLRVDGHAVLANAAAMAAAGISAATPDPAGGRIERDEKGNPTGVFVDAAMSLLERAVPALSSADRDRAIAKAQDLLLANGITATADMGTDFESWQSMQRLCQSGRLRLRIVSYALGVDNQRRAAPNGPTPWLCDGRLRMLGVKLFADGALGSRGAWLKQAYADMPDQRGLAFYSDTELKLQMRQVATLGFQVAVHAIGDAANSQVLAAIDDVARDFKGDQRWRIEHAQVVDPGDLSRFRMHGTIASMQPSHATSDHRMAAERLGPARLTGAYAWRTMLDNNVPLAFGSDYPVESSNPFQGLADAITREDAAGDPPGGFIPDQRLDLTGALAAFTTGAAYAAKAENRLGSLQPGRFADFVLLHRDPFRISAKDLRGTKVMETWISGKKVWPR